MSNYWKKWLDEIEKNNSPKTEKKSNGNDGGYWRNWLEEVEQSKQPADIAPVAKTTISTEDEEYRDANLWDITWRSLQRGYYNSRYGEESYKALFGEENEKDVFQKILEGDEYKFTPSNIVEKGVSGAFELLGQIGRQSTHPRTIAAATTAAGGALALGQAGPQVLAPEEIITVPTAFVGGMVAGNAASAFEIEAGLAYNEMIDNGISEKTAKAIALGVGGANAALELVQADELLKAFKVLDNTGATKGVTKRIAKELGRRGLGVAKETAQEVAQEGVTIAGAQLASQIDKGEWAYTKEDVVSRLGETALSSALSFGVMNVPAASVNINRIVSDNSNTQELTQNEQMVVDKEVESRVAEQEKDGKKLTPKEKTVIREAVIREMERGYITTDTIEEVLGAEAMSLVQSDRLVESYNEARRRGEDFVPDFDKIKGVKFADAAKRTLENAVRLGMNNTNKIHDFVDFATKTSGDTGRVIDFKTGEQIRSEFIETQTAKIAEIEKIENPTPEQSKQLEDMREILAKVQSGETTIHGYVTDSGIVLNIDSENALNRVVGHEVMHSLERSKYYNRLRKALFAYAKTKGVDIDGELARRTATYAGISNANPETELVTDLVGNYLFSDGEFVKQLSVTDRNVFQRIYDEIKYLYKIATAGSKEARELERVKKIFEDVYRGTKNAATDSGVKYSIVALENGNVYVKASRNVIQGETKSEQRREITEFFNQLLEGNQSLEIQTIEGDVLAITKGETADKARDDFKSINGQPVKMSDEEFTVKMHIESHIDEVAEVSTQRGFGSDKKNHGFAKDGFTYRRAYFEDFDGQYYEVTLSIGNNGTVATVYNVGKIKESVSPSAKVIAVVGSKPLGETHSEDSMPQKEKTVKKQFYLSEAVEETKDLIAVHNLHASELLETLNLSGLPSPSVAIVKAKDGHEKYGDVSLILPKDAIDPQANKANRIYGSDAWTPTRSNAQVEYEVDYGIQRQFERSVEALSKNVANGVFSKSSVLGMAGIEDSTSLNMTEVVKKISDYDAVWAAYVAENGGNVEIVYREKEFDTYGNEVLKSYIDKVGEQEVARLTAKLMAGDRLTAEEFEAAKDAIVDDWTAKREYSLKRKPELREARIAAFRERLNTIRVEDFIRHAWEFYEDSGATTDEINVAATGDNLRAAANRADVEAWVTEKLEGLLSEPGIYNGKEIFTQSGRRRSFKDTHWEYTAENIVRAMNNADARGANVWNVSGEAIIATATSEYKNIDEVRADKDRLYKADDDYYEQIKDDISSELQTVTQDIVRTTEHYSDNQYDEEQIIGRVIMEAAQGTKTVAGVKGVFQKNGYRISDAQAMSVLSLFDHASSVPAGYFEAKPQRVVGFDEVGVYVIPNNADVKLKQELLNRGYAIAEYDPNIEGHRQQVVNQFEEYKFSLSDAGKQSFAPRTSFDVFGKDLKLETAPVEETAPIRETVAETAPVAESRTPVEQMFPDDLAPVDQELDRLIRERDALEARMQNMADTGDFSELEAVDAQWQNVVNRIEALEAEAKEADDGRLSSLDDADAPPVREMPYDERGNQMTMPKSVVNMIAQNVKSSLAVSDRQMGEVHRLIEEYSVQEFPSRDQLYRDLRSRFGTYTDSTVQEDVREVKTALRKYRLNVSDTIKSEIADYNDLRRRNFGKVLFSRQGVPVDVAYMELSEWYPGFFPKDIISPTDQLLQIIDVANRSHISEQTHAVDDAVIWDVTDDIIEAVHDYQHTQRGREAERVRKGSFEDLAKHGDEIAPVTRSVLSNPPKNPDAVMDEAPTYDAQPRKGVVEGQQAMFKEESAKPETRKQLHQSIVDGIKETFKAKGYDFDAVLRRAKNLSTFATVDNIPQRVMEKALGYKEGQVLSDLTVNRVAQNETDGIRWLNSFTDRKSGLLRQISDQYHIKPGSKESAAAQMYAEGFYVGENNDIIKYGDAELAKDFPDARVQANIKGLARDPRIRQIYDDTLALINEARTRNAYPEIQKLENYFLHFRAMDDTFSRLGLPFNPNDIRAKDLPTDLNGVTADLKPGQPYFASAMHRTGKRTSFDLLGGLERYLTSAKNQIYHIDDIQTLRALRNYIADTYGQANGLEGLDALSEEEAQERIEKVYSAHLSTFARFLNEEANILAGKTALIDRGLEGILGRRGMTFLDTLNKQVGSNMVGYNISSSLTNFLPVVQTFAKTNKFDFVRAFAQTVGNKFGSLVGRTDGFAENSPVIIRRNGADRFYRTPWQKAGDAGYLLMGAVDNISTEIIARTKYNELTRNGMDAQTAHYETDKWVSRLMGDRSLGQMPHVFNSKMLGLVTKFQLEVRNQLDSQFYDTIQEAKVSNEHIENRLARNARTAARVASTFVQLAVGQHLFGKAFESVAGYNPAFDIIGVLMTAFGFDDEEDSEDTALDNIEQGFLELLEDLPYTSAITGGGRIPISSALPVGELVKGVDEWGNEKSRWKTLGEIAPYYVLPGGYGQIKKTAQGLSMFSGDHPVAGSYTDSGNLRFPVEDTVGNRVQAGIFGQWANENARTYFDNNLAPLNEKQVQEFSALGLSYDDYWTYRDDMTAISKRAEADGASDEDVVKSKYINSVNSELSEIQTEKDKVMEDAKLSAAEKEAKIRELDKQFADLANERYSSYNNVSFDGDFASIGDHYYQWYTPENGESYWRKLDEDQIAKYQAIRNVGANAHYATNGTTHYRLEEGGDPKNFSDWTKISDKDLARQQEVTKELGITPEQYWRETEVSFIPMKKGEYEYAFDNPENYAVAKAVGGYDAYRSYSTDLSNITADKDKNGKSISGSRKEKVLDYINNLDADYYTKIILYKSEYTSDDTYNEEIIEYLNSRDDISFEETIAILRKLGFDVTDDGDISW